MTKDQIYDAMARCCETWRYDVWPEAIDRLADAVLAAGASEGQAVAKVMRSTIAVPGGEKHRNRAVLFEDAQELPHGTPLYAAPQPDARDAEIAALRERIAGMEKDAGRWRELKQHTRDTEITRGCTASEYGQANWLLNYATMDEFMDECIKSRARRDAA
jgi:hypothetical protein